VWGPTGDPSGRLALLPTWINIVGVFTSILCPVDFSVHSERALGFALDLAALSGAHLTVITVVDSFLDAAANASGTHDALAAQTQQEIKGLLDRMTASRGQTPPPVGVSVEVGAPAEEILKQADECRADLIVMGTQGLEGPRRFFFGSTTERVLRESRIPVLAIPADIAP
jgi:nucleotide-binding universal stress UspA family protein